MTREKYSPKPDDKEPYLAGELKETEPRNWTVEKNKETGLRLKQDHQTWLKRNLWLGPALINFVGSIENLHQIAKHPNPSSKILTMGIAAATITFTVGSFSLYKWLKDRYK